MARLAFAVLLALAASAASAAPGFTFCVATTKGGGDVWISPVFGARTSGEKAADAFAAAVVKLGGTGAEARCPGPRGDRAVAADAQTEVGIVSHALGAEVHAVAAADFPDPAEAKR